jgi:hypothetical protein
MSAQPIHEEDPLDPEVIYRDLPERERPLFAREYREHVHAAAEHLSGYRDLKNFLHGWSLIVVATNRPGYYEAIEDAKAGRGGSHPFGEVIARERTRRA